MRTLVICSPLPAVADTADRNWLKVSTSLVGGSGVSTLPVGLESVGERPQISLLTDLDNDRADELLVALDRFDVLLDQYVALFAPVARKIAPSLALRRRTGPNSEPLELVLMRRRGDFNRVFQAGHFAAFTVPTLKKTTLVVGPGGTGRDSMRENLFHEYVHYRLRRDVPGGLPLWFEEGLASFLSHIEFSSPDPSEFDASYSRPLKFRLGKWTIAKNQELMPLKELLSIRDLRGLGRGKLVEFYATSHAFVRHLFVDERIDPGMLAASLVLGAPAFPDGLGIDLQRAGKSMRLLTGRGLKARGVRDTRRLNERRRNGLDGTIVVRQRPETLDVRSIAANDVRESLAGATLLMNPVVSEGLFARVLKSQPDRLSALLGYVHALRLQSKEAEASEILNLAIALAPSNPDVLLEQAALSTSGCILRRRTDCNRRWEDATFSLRDVLDEQPDNYEAIYRLGLAHLYLGQAGEAQGYLEIAWRQAPWSPRVNYFLGESMRLSGDRRARWYLSNAARWSASDFFLEASRTALDLIETTQRQAEE